MFDFDTCIVELERETHRNWSKSGKETLTITKLNFNANQLKIIANTLHSENKFDEAAEFFKQALKNYQITTRDSCRDENLENVIYRIGCGLLSSSYYTEA